MPTCTRTGKRDGCKGRVKTACMSLRGNDLVAPGQERIGDRPLVFSERATALYPAPDQDAPAAC